jgi:hypothetical protein
MPDALIILALLAGLAFPGPVVIHDGHVHNLYVTQFAGVDKIEDCVDGCPVGSLPVSSGDAPAANPVAGVCNGFLIAAWEDHLAVDPAGKPAVYFAHFTPIEYDPIPGYGMWSSAPLGLGYVFGHVTEIGCYQGMPWVMVDGTPTFANVRYWQVFVPALAKGE